MNEHVGHGGRYQSAFTHMARQAVPGPYHAVKDANGIWHVSGQPDCVVTNESTVRAAVDALNQLTCSDE